MLDRWLKPVARPGASAKAVRRRASSSDDEIDAADPGPPAKGPRLEIGTSAVGVADEPVAKEAPPHPVPSARQPLPLGVVRSASLPPVTKTYASRRTRHTPPGLISDAMVTFDATLWAPRSSPGPTPRRAPAWEQTCLNLGQRGTHLAACAECGMRYNPAGAEDRRLHTRHHRTVLAQPVWRAPSGAARGGGPRVVWDHRVCAPPAAAAAAAPLGGRVIQLAAGSPRVWRQRAARLLDAMASHLNAGQAAADDLAPAPTPAPTVGGALATLWARGDGRAQQHQISAWK
ncbi:hypothetical protein CXG81DRAFT_28217 [Caulochytrium protostelioides]|uniref:N-acetyltransferase ESCO zinc-finger domain-containing protein n=1 Tax=Caulochytrium protostelioides TaxID=1555241 RepID=A0A4P9X1G4_9FUNG|nr:hypothetical protein CXG81DRAFT_28217 [Caulochytrium protostelioides]|eukprot:RKO98992.1 hypothetical protein CXG81DRAFT_28217 [Caulochytrium protostelioides]